MTVSAVVGYADGFEHLAAELQRLDILLQRRLHAIKSSQNNVLPEFIIAWLEATTTTSLTDFDHQLETSAALIQTRLELTPTTVWLPLVALARWFNLSALELMVLIASLAPQLRRDYHKIYAYLQGEPTANSLTINFILELLFSGERERWTARPFLAAHSLLFSTQLLELADNGSLTVDPRIMQFILGNATLDSRVQPWLHWVKPAKTIIEVQLKPQLLNLVQYQIALESEQRSNQLIHLYGKDGVGKRQLALAVCQQLGIPLLALDLAAVLRGEFTQLLPLALRETLLSQAALYLYPLDHLTPGDPAIDSLLQLLTHWLSKYSWLTFTAAQQPLPAAWHDFTVISLELTLPSVVWRHQFWQQQLQAQLPQVEFLPELSQQLVTRFELTPGQISQVVNTLAAKQHGQTVTATDLNQACQHLTQTALRQLATHIEPHADFSRLILPEDKIAQLQEIITQIQQQDRVMNQWGFAQQLGYGKGISVLFSGPPGTGKTLAASVIAHELQLNLFKIDLANIVSKYIGETEKNLAQLFQAATASGAILFFDEADALFGKRTQISDAHDRYANLEVSYLLQQMEQYNGIVILATNLRDNLDEAFIRRIRFIVEFPFPNAANRHHIWQQHFPSTAPVSDNLDYDWLAQQLAIAGGNIKNIVLNAAFLAAGTEEPINMPAILHATRRELDKMGKLFDEQSWVKLSK